MNSEFNKKEIPGSKKIFSGKSDAQKEKEIAEHLSAMIACPTVSLESGGKEEAFVELYELLQKIYPLTHSRLQTYKITGFSRVLRWQGKKSSKPAILMAHQDVVEATGNWKYDPFAGTIAEGYVWGRGTVDDKGCLCALLQAVENLLKEDFEPEQDIYLVMSHNEEIMGNGAPLIVEWMRENEISPAFVLDEGGAIVDNVLPSVEGQTAMIGTCEKGYINIRFTARSQGGHASTPPKVSPLGRLARLIAEIENTPPFPARLNTVTRELFSCLAPKMKSPLKIVFGNLWLFAPILPLLLKKSGGEARAMVMTTCAFTMAQGSGAANVLPETASVTANLRVAVHQTTEEVIASLEKIAAKLDIDCEVLYKHNPSPISSLNNDQALFMKEAISEIFGDITIAPYTMLAASDSHHFNDICPSVYRFTPFHLTKELRSGMHGLDEKLPVSELCRAVDFYEKLIEKYR